MAFEGLGDWAGDETGNLLCGPARKALRVQKGRQLCLVHSPGWVFCKQHYQGIWPAFFFNCLAGLQGGLAEFFV
jgi:hypothetical protein